MQNRCRRSNLELRGPRNGLKNWFPKLWRSAFCAVVRADSESADGAGRRARRRRFWGCPGGRNFPGKPCAT
eukprot:15440504-Alexandrium_andersonii.AAC.1